MSVQSVVPSDGGLIHLMTSLEALEDDFNRLDNTLEGLFAELQVILPPSSPIGASATEPEFRSVIDRITRKVRYLQGRSEAQRGLVERLREAIS